MVIAKDGIAANTLIAFEHWTGLKLICRVIAETIEVEPLRCGGLECFRPELILCTALQRCLSLLSRLRGQRELTAELFLIQGSKSARTDAGLLLLSDGSAKLHTNS